jgi:hypothetical protein
MADQGHRDPPHDSRGTFPNRSASFCLLYFDGFAVDLTNDPVSLLTIGASEHYWVTDFKAVLHACTTRGGHGNKHLVWKWTAGSGALALSLGLFAEEMIRIDGLHHILEGQLFALVVEKVRAVFAVPKGTRNL